MAAARRVHLTALASQGDPEAEAELYGGPELPRLAAHLWRAFLELSRTRQSGAVGPGPITRSEIRLWEADEGQLLEPWERRAILSLDQAWLKSIQPKT